MEQEIWKPVVNYEGLYEVSNLGRVKSVPRKGTKGGMLRLLPDDKGYLRVNPCKNGKQEPCLVHILVMRAFVGECPEGYEVDHYDWNPSNNRLENLSYQLKGVNRARRSPEWKKNQAEAMQKLAQDPEWQKKRTETNRRLAQNPEWLQNVAEAAKKRAADPEWLRKNAEQREKMYKDTEWRRKTAEATRKACCKPVNQYTLDGEYVKTWESAADASRELVVNRQKISACCNGKRKKTGGYIWRYAEKEAG